MSLEKIPNLREYVEAKALVSNLVDSHHEVEPSTIGELVFDIEQDARTRHLSTQDQARLESLSLRDLAKVGSLNSRERRRALLVLENLTNTSVDSAKLSVVYDRLNAQRKPWEKDLIEQFSDPLLQSTDSGKTSVCDPGKIEIGNLGIFTPIKGFYDLIRLKRRERNSPRENDTVLEYVFGNKEIARKVAENHRSAGIKNVRVIRGGWTYSIIKDSLVPHVDPVYRDARTIVAQKN